MRSLSISLLGPFRVDLDEEPVTQIKGDKMRALLAYLALHAQAPCRRTALTGVLWPDQPDSAALHNMRQMLGQLRAALRDRESEIPFLLVTRQSVQFNPTSDCWLDVAAFSEAVAASRQHEHHRLETCPSCAQRLREAVALYRGEFLAGLSVDSAPFEEWLVVQREALHRQVLDALHALAAYHERRGEYEQVMSYARRQVALEPWRESAHRQAMRALALSGERNAALAQYEACRRAVMDELGIEPEEETTALYHRILSATHEGPVRSVEPSRAEIRTQEPSEGRFSPTAHNLPTPLTPFVGRESYLAEIAGYLQDPTCRLLSLVGPGGIGKTRLALEAAARQVGSYDGGVCFCPLAPAQSTDGAVFAVAQALGFSFYEAEGGAEADPWRQLLNYLRGKNVLLVLDNVEHLLAGAAADAGPEAGRRDVVDLIADILRNAPDVQIVTTSRVRLNTRSEQLLPVGGMDYPPLTAGAEAHVPGETRSLAAYSAVKLFLQSARRVRQDLDRDETVAHVGRICRLVGGMPLAILLAAAWMEVLSPAEIADQIERGLEILETDERDVPARHRSVQAVFDASWEMLSGAERGAFARLSVFRGGFTGQAASQVAGADPRTLRALAHKSFLQPSRRGRYEVHELLRQYGTSKLGEAPSAMEEARDGHSAYYAAALQRWERDLKCARQQAALDEIDIERENIRAAWEWAAERGQVALLDRGTMGLWLSCFYRLWRQEGDMLFQEAAERLSVERPPRTAERLRVLAKVLAAQSAFRGPDRAGALQRQSMALLKGRELAAQDTRPEEAFLLLVMGSMKFYTDREEASRACERSLAMYRALCDRWGTAWALSSWGRASRTMGEFGQAEQRLAESTAIFRALGDRIGAAWSLLALGYIAMHRGQLEEAERLMQESRSIYQAMGNQAPAVSVLVGLGSVAMRGGQFARARLLLERSRAFWHELGDLYRVAASSASLAAVRWHQGEYEQGRRLVEKVLSFYHQREERVNRALALRTLGCIALAEGAYAEAERALQECLAILTDYGAEQIDRGIVTRAALACAARGLGRVSEGEQYLAEALRRCLETPALWPPLYAIAACALFLVDRGEVERAVEVYALPARYPLVANSRWFEDVAGAHVAAAAEHPEGVPPDVVTAAQARGRARDLVSTAEELLRYLA